MNSFSLGVRTYEIYAIQVLQAAVETNGFDAAAAAKERRLLLGFLASVVWLMQS